MLYQSQYDRIGLDVGRLVSSNFQNPEQVNLLNNTLITLIPMVEPIMSLKQLRLINLCNVSDKLVTKILATRLKSCMENIVAPPQCSFVPSRQS